MKALLQQIYNALPLLCLATLGVIIKGLHGPWTGWKRFVSSLSTAGFGALLIGLCAHDFHLSEGMTYFLSGMIGYSGGSLVDSILAVMEKKIGDR